MLWIEQGTLDTRGRTRQPEELCLCYLDVKNDEDCCEEPKCTMTFDGANVDSSLNKVVVAVAVVLRGCWDVSRLRHLYSDHVLEGLKVDLMARTEHILWL